MAEAALVIPDDEDQAEHESEDAEALPEENTDPLFVLRLPFRKPGAVYTLQASVKGDGGTASNGTVYLTNWN